MDSSSQAPSQPGNYNDPSNFPVPLFSYTSPDAPSILLYGTRNKGFGCKLVALMPDSQRSVPVSCIPCPLSRISSPAQPSPWTVTQSFCPFCRVIGMTWSLTRRVTSKRTWRRLTATAQKYIHLRYQCQDKSALDRAYRMSRSERPRFKLMAATERQFPHFCFDHPSSLLATPISTTSGSTTSGSTTPVANAPPLLI